MKSFLEETANDILKKYSNKESVCIVFPNKRTLHFFRKAYADVINQTTVSGNFLTINQVISQLSGYLTVEGGISLLFSLYDAFNQVFSGDMLNAHIASRFDKFYDTGNKLLKDFNEVDNYLVDLHQLCQNFADLAEIDAFYAENNFDEEQINAIKSFWENFSPEKLSHEKRRYMELWVNIPKVYDIFVNKILEKKIAYTGLVNKIICNKIKNGTLNPKFKTYIFVGFNALNKAERKIFSYFKNNGKGKFYWDADNYYINNLAQEAGLFMRGYLKDYPNELKSNFDNILHHPKDVEYIGIPLEVGQSKAVYDILDSFAKKEDFVPEKTAVILGDEHLLFPVLHSLPPSISSVNVTMGYPFKETSVYSLINNCIALRKNLKGKNNSASFYFKDVLAILQHPLICNLTGVYANRIVDNIIQNRMIRVSSTLFETECQLLKLIFCFYSSENKSTDILFQLMNVLEEYFFIKNPNLNPQETIENEYVFSAYTSIKALYNVLKDNADRYHFSDDLVISLLHQNIDSISIPFDSENISGGVQIMGMIETRNIDFDNIILLGMNDGVFPKISENESFITESMRLAFDMPVSKYKDAIFAYFFYRLFQRSKNVKVLYNNVFGQNISGELSRFAIQLLKEASKTYNSNSELNIVQKELARNISPLNAPDINVDNCDDSINRLERYVYKDIPQSALSPSALNTYIDCPLKFYFQYIAKLKPEDQIEEDISPADFGTILHATIESIYNSIKNDDGYIYKENLNISLPIIESHILEAYNKTFKVKLKAKESLEGFHKIFFEVLIQYIQRIIDYDKKNSPFKFLSAEQGAYSTIDIHIGNQIKKVSIGGKIDRVDIDNKNRLRIVDYKTGNVAGKMVFDNIESLFSFDDKHKNSVAFQLMFYSYVFIQRSSYKKLPIPIIYAVKDIIAEEDTYFKYKVDNTSIKIDDSNIKQLTDDFSVHLKSLIEKIFNCDKFEANPTFDNCKYCKFAELCKNNN
ncbi:MAG: exodeoxyribonuclease V subunit gamma [Bacteroidales bacterium]|nr:exodeoxyribonuclease V subunit gamma [Bacteroidales bacterium]